MVKAIDAFDNVLTRGPEDTKPPSRRILLVLEWMSGGELFQRITTKRKFTEKEASAVTRQIVSAMHFLHEKNIAHRDLKVGYNLYCIINLSVRVDVE